MNPELRAILIQAGIPIGIGVLAGLISELVVLRQLRRLAERSKGKFDDILVDAFRRLPLLWCTLAGIYFALTAMELPAKWSVVIGRALTTVIIISITLLAARIAGGLVVHYSAGATGVFRSTSLFRNLTVMVVVLLGGLVWLQTFGISITPMLTALGVGGLAVALALQDTLSNLFAGLQIIISQQLRVGDYVKLETGEEGYVTDIRWRNTTIRALPNNLIIVPNSKLASNIITNYYLPQQEMSVLVQVGVAYDSDLELVERVTIAVGKEVMAATQGGVPESEPFIRYHTFDASSINFSVILRAREFVDQYLIKHEFIKRLQARYREENITIPFPIRTVHLKAPTPDKVA